MSEFTYYKNSEQHFYIPGRIAIMKKIIMQISTVALVASLTACATNTQKENTIVGAGTGAVAGGLLGSLASGAGAGWVVAGGAVVGALIGGVIGHNMESSDTVNVNTAMDKNSINQPSNWTNDKTGTWYKIVPTSDMITYKGNSNCRSYVAYGKTHSGKTYKTSGIACRMKDGMWQQVK
jgi:surface antigen